jgi:hypothetical protein
MRRHIGATPRGPTSWGLAKTDAINGEQIRIESVKGANIGVKSKMRKK